MSATLALDIVTPSGTVYSGRANGVTLPSTAGEIGVLPGHAPMLTRATPGEVRVRTPDGEEVLAIGEGLVLVASDRVAIVTDMAIAAKDIDEMKVEEARQRALARLRERISDEEVATVNASLARSLAQLRVKRRKPR